ncbi:glycoside hydrolase family 71 protein, partial [Xylogone sp. PMI_703]
MRLLSSGLAVLLLGASHVSAKAVFAHFMVSNAANYSVGDWEDEIQLAQDAHIDAFALNIAFNQDNDPQIANSFTAANNLGFQLFFSFDYAGNGPWPQSEVISLLEQYGSNGAHYRYNGQPFVSTFEGPENAEDWITIKAQIGCFFVPSWSSQGAKAALELANGVADGLFSWAAWPWGDRDMDTFVDASYLQYLDGKPYMMPVSPWFYTNLPGYNKNWLWRGDDLWFDRWQQVLYVQPEWVEIVTWNDYGESHYVGPLRDNAMELFTIGEASYNYAENMPHDAWRLTLPFSIDMYVKNSTTINEEAVVFWYRPQPAQACSDGQTTGNTASQLQVEFSATEVVQDKVFYTALLGSSASVSVSVGGIALPSGWTWTPQDGVGLYHGSVSLNGALGEVSITITRGGSVIASQTGIAISTDCINGLENWNAWVGGAVAGGSISATPTSMDDQVCINGTSVNNFIGICSFACNFGYCPVGACLCTQMGTQIPKPSPVNVNGYPVEGEDASYSGLCAFDCNLGFCP